jgi:co-chaperonin GroES (HSP10)
MGAVAVAVDLTRPETLSGPIERLRNDNILVQVETRADRDGYKGPLVLPDIEHRGRSEDLERVPMWGYAVMVGDKVREVGKGDRVLTNYMAGDPIWIGGSEYRVVRESAIMAVDEGVQ